MEPLLRNEDLQGELLPGILNDITLSEITQKLSWRDIPSLSSVSRHWEKAIQGYLVHHERIRTHSAESFAVFAQRSTKDRKIKLSLYSMRNKTWIQLPQVPHPERRALCFRCVSLDGKIYVLGGNCRERLETTVYMLDLAGQRRWKQCASMGESRNCFGTAVLNGKIYVFGGQVNNKTITGATVYDPQVDSWSTIKPMLSFRRNPQVVALGEELVVYDGLLYTPGANGELDWDFWDSGARSEVYNPVSDEWRSIQSFGDFVWEPKFLAQGKFHTVTPQYISVYDIDTHSWSLRQSCSFPESGPVERTRIVPCGQALVVDSEILQVVMWYGKNCVGDCLLHGKRFGHETEAIDWEVVKCAPRHKKSRLIKEVYMLMCTIEL